MSTAQSAARTGTQWKPNDAWLVGPKRPMICGSAIAGVGILLTSMTFTLIGQYIVLAVIGFTLFGIGLGFYATPSTDAACAGR